MMLIYQGRWARYSTSLLPLRNAMAAFRGHYRTASGVLLPLSWPAALSAHAQRRTITSHVR